jgi:outer membrane lipoprotein SlyB
MLRTIGLMGIIVAALVATGCTLPSRGDVYSRQDTRKAWDVRYGEVTDVDPVTIEGQRSALGRVGGGYVGYEVGRAIGGRGTSGDVGGAVGAVAGAVAGEAVEEGVTRQDGLQISVRLDEGRTIAVVQAADQRFEVGERVKIYSRGDGATRVAKL